MGQSISLSLVTQIKVKKPKKNNAILNEIIELLNKDFPTDLALFNLSEDDSSYVWQLKTTILENELIPLLEKFYPSFYKDEDDIEYYQNTLKQLRADINSDSWFELAKDGSEYYFQYNDDCELDSIRYKNNWLDVDYKAISLSFAGKISLETQGGLLKYLTECVQLRFNDYRLASCLKLHISE